MHTDMRVPFEKVSWELIPAEPKARVLSFLDFSTYLTTRVVSVGLKNFADQNIYFWSSQFASRFGNFDQVMNDIKKLDEFSPHIAKFHTSYFQIYRLALEKILAFSKFHFPDPQLIVSGCFKQMALMPSTNQREASLFLIDESSLIKRINPGRFFLSKQAPASGWYTSFKLSEQPSCLSLCNDMLFVGTAKGNLLVYKIANEQGKDALDLISVISLDTKIQSVESAAKGDRIGLVIISSDPVSNDVTALIYGVDAAGIPVKAARIKPEKPHQVSGPFFGKELQLYCPLLGGGILVYDLDKQIGGTGTMSPESVIHQNFEIKILLPLRDHLVFATTDGRLGWVEANKPEQNPGWLKIPMLITIQKITPVKELGFCLHGERGERIVFLRRSDNTYSSGYCLIEHMNDPQWMENGKVIYRNGGREEENGLYLADLSHSWVEEILSKLQKTITKAN